MKGQIINEFFEKSRDGVARQFIHLVGSTGAPQYNRFYAHEKPEKARFVTCIYTHDEPDAEPQKHTVVFWGDQAYEAKRVLMDSPRVAVIEIYNGRVNMDEYEGVFRSQVSINWPRQFNVLDVWDYGRGFKQTMAEMDECPL